MNAHGNVDKALLGQHCVDSNRTIAFFHLVFTKQAICRNDASKQMSR